MQQKPERYNSVAIILHWLMACAFLLMFVSGVIMEYFEVDKALKFNLYQWHKSGGVLLLIAFCVRIIWRFISDVPSFPDGFKAMDKLLAKLGHWGLYLLMFALPLSGWLMVSSSIYGLPTIVFGLFEWPHIPNVQADKTVYYGAELAHFVLAITFFALIVGHIAAVVKHRIFDKKNLMTRMWWSKKKD